MDDTTDEPVLTVSISEVDLTRWRQGGEADRRALADEVRVICHHIGFFHLVGHGLSPALLAEHAGFRARFFALPEETKRRIDKVGSPHFRGWEPVGAELTGGRPDQREQLDLAVENPVRGLRADPPYLRLDGPNQWLPDEVLPGFRDHLACLFAALSALADELLGVLSVGLGLAEDHLERLFGDRPLSLVKLISYPPTPQGEAGVNAHHDAGFLTLVLQDDEGGLQAEAPDGTWVDVPPRTDAFVVNLGEMLQEMSGNYYVATTHRVITGVARFSSAWFHGPALETELTPLPLAPELAAAVAASPRHAGAGFMARREELESGVAGIASSAGAGVYGQQLWNYYRRSYPNIMRRHHPDCA
ncbi:MAG: isopenicillin N synthase family oxygenase [Acidimicrobiia bacterium]|nr:isopenicillin N synthase family oxygenase [Acidimicrobiia bacterium]